MAQTRKLVRDAIVSVLSHATKGFNARLSAIATSYDVTPYLIAWDNGSNSFFQGQTNTPELTQLNNDDFTPVLLQLYSGVAQGQNLSKPRQFSGVINVALDFTVQYREGMEADDIEDRTDIVCDAVESALYDPTAAWPTGVTLSANFTSEKQPAELLEDGWRQRIIEYLQFVVEV